MFGKSVKTVVITTNFIFLITNIIFTLLALILANYVSKEIAKRNPIDTLISKIDKKDDNSYQNIPVKRYIGNKGYIEILDENLNLIYSGNSNQHRKYTPEVMNFISDLDKNTSYYINLQQRSDNKVIYVISEYRYRNSQNSEYEYFSDLLSGTTILDKNYKLVYSDMDICNLGSLTDSDINILFDNNDDTFSVKHTFFNAQNQKRYMIAHLDSSSNPVSVFNSNLILYSILFCVISTIILNIVFSNIIVKKVVRPVMAINKALKDIAEEKTIDKKELLKLKDFTNIAHALENTLTIMQERKFNYEKIIKEKTEYISEYAHDIKNSFMSLSIYLNKLKNTSSYEEIKDYIETLSRISEEAEELFHNLTDYNMISNPNFRLNLSLEDLTITFRKFVVDAYKEFKFLGYSTKIKINASKVIGQYDCKQLLRVFNNIKYNFMKYCTNENTIYFFLKVSPETVSIELGNDGTPIDPSIRDEIFQPYTTGNNKYSSKKSSGIGLALAKKIVSMHSGKIELLDNNHNIFHIELPLTYYKRSKGEFWEN